jgi:hypothetical protein
MGTTEMIYAAVASVIGGLVLLTMFGVQRKGQDASVDAVQYRTSKSSMLSLAEIMERDFHNMGAYMYWDGAKFVGVAVDPKDVLEPLAYDSVDVTGGKRYKFEFLSQTDSLQAPWDIRYEWEPINGKTVTLNDGAERQLHELRRYQDGVLTYSDRLLTEFSLELLPDTTVTPFLVNLDEARVFKVTVRGVSPLGKARTVEETRFDATYRPIGMTVVR